MRTERMSDRLIRMNIGFNDGDVLYDECVVFPRDIEIIRGEFDLEPFDSLNDRFTIFELKANEEIESRARDTWNSIVDFVESLNGRSKAENLPYEIYIREVERYKKLISSTENNGGYVNFRDLISSFFIDVEKIKKAAA